MKRSNINKKSYRFNLAMLFIACTSALVAHNIEQPTEQELADYIYKAGSKFASDENDFNAYYLSDITPSLQSRSDKKVFNYFEKKANTLEKEMDKMTIQSKLAQEKAIREAVNYENMSSESKADFDKFIKLTPEEKAKIEAQMEKDIKSRNIDPKKIKTIRDNAINNIKKMNPKEKAIFDAKLTDQERQNLKSTMNSISNATSDTSAAMLEFYSNPSLESAYAAVTDPIIGITALTGVTAVALYYKYQQYIKEQARIKEEKEDQEDQERTNQ